MSLQVPLVTSLTFRSRGAPGRSANPQRRAAVHLSHTVFSHRSLLSLLGGGGGGLTEHHDSDFDHFVSCGALGIDDVSAAVAQFALWEDDERAGVCGVNLRRRQTDGRLTTRSPPPTHPTPSPDLTER